MTAIPARRKSLVKPQQWYHELQGALFRGRAIWGDAWLACLVRVRCVKFSRRLPTKLLAFFSSGNCELQGVARILMVSSYANSAE